MRAVCVRHSKKLTVPARQRENDEHVAPLCSIGTYHENRDILTEPTSSDFEALGERRYKDKLEEFEMFWGQAI